MTGAAVSPFFTPFFPLFMSENLRSMLFLFRFISAGRAAEAFPVRGLSKIGAAEAFRHQTIAKQRTPVLFLVVAVLTICITACGGKKQSAEEDMAARDAARHAADSAGWLTLERDDCRIRYPKDWTLRPASDDVVFYLYAPSEGEGDRFRENVSLVVELLPNGRYDADSYVEETLKLLQGMVKENKSVQWDGRECRKIVYTQCPAMGIVTINTLYVWVINGKAYLLASSREDGHEGGQAEASQRIAQTFEFR